MRPRLICEIDKCGKLFKTPAALGSHKLSVHGIAGTSSGSKAHKAKRGKRKYERKVRAPIPVLAPSGDVHAAIAALEMHIDAFKTAIQILKGVAQ